MNYYPYVAARVAHMEIIVEHWVEKNWAHRKYTVNQDPCRYQGMTHIVLMTVTDRTAS